jgi:hypothetical protein
MTAISLVLRIGGESEIHSKKVYGLFFPSHPPRTNNQLNMRSLSRRGIQKILTKVMWNCVYTGIR